MKTITIVSDTHGNISAIEKLFPVFAESDYIIHLGDTSGDGQTIMRRFPEKTYLLNGNCDLHKLGKNETVLKIEDVKIFACHGDRYGVKSGYFRLAARAAEESCSVALFGHTHTPTEESVNGVMLFNPGTMKRYAPATYLYLVVNGDKAVGKICTLQNT